MTAMVIQALSVLHTDVENLSKALGAAAREESEKKDPSHILVGYPSELDPRPGSNYRVGC